MVNNNMCHPVVAAKDSCFVSFGVYKENNKKKVKSRKHRKTKMAPNPIPRGNLFALR